MNEEIKRGALFFSKIIHIINKHIKRNILVINNSTTTSIVLWKCILLLLDSYDIIKTSKFRYINANISEIIPRKKNNWLMLEKI
jgi:hypothetical protein